MTARVLIVKNIQREGPGLLRDVLQEHGVAADVIELDRGDRIPSPRDYEAMVVLGGPASANDQSEVILHELERVGEAINSNIPYLGICLGLQLLVKAAGGQVVRAIEREIGFFDGNGTPYVNDLTQAGREDPLFAGVANRFRVFQLHGETVELNGVTQLLATSSGCPNQAVRVGRRAYGLQAHIEVVPEMLAVWGAQDEMLAGRNMVEMQLELGNIHEQYARNARLMFVNFLALSGLISTVDISLEQPQELHAR